MTTATNTAATETAAKKTIVFDIGNVLVEWDAHLVWLDEMGSREAVDAFLTRVDFFARNLRADKGERFGDLALEITDPADRAAFAAYLPNYHKAMPRLIEGTWAIRDRLAEKGHAVHAITNWSPETWPVGLAAFPQLTTAFGVTVVSGHEGEIKPDPQIFALLCERANVAREDCIFIDDSEKNVLGALAFGMDAIHFTGPEALEAALAERGIL